jgi:hypothetical protein
MPGVKKGYAEGKEGRTERERTSVKDLRKL